jgi:hypothetical protein
LHSLAEQEIRSKTKNNNNSTFIKTTADDGIEFIPVHEKDPADNIHSTPIIEHHPADDILVHPIHEFDPSDNILSTPIPDPQLPDVCGIPILEPHLTELSYNTKEECGWSMPEGGGYINGRWYSQHALERMAPDTPLTRAILQERARNSPKITSDKEYLAYVDPRGVPPMVVEDIILNGERYAGSLPDRENFTDKRFTVIVGKDTKAVITVKHFEQKDCEHS